MTASSVAIPQWTPTQRELDDLDLLVNGCFEPPLPGFVDPRTAGDAAPITLQVNADIATLAQSAGEIDLVDPEGAPLARLTVEGTWPSDDGSIGLRGPVRRLAPNSFGPFRRLHIAPDALHVSYDRGALLAVPVTRPLTVSDIDTIQAAADAEQRTVLLLACVGEGMADPLTGPALMRATLVASTLLQGSVEVVAVSTADHGRTGRHGNWRSPNEWLLSSVASAYASRVLRLADEPSDRLQDSRERLPDPIATIVDQALPPRDQQGIVVFFTGLSGSGKSTLARALVDHVLERGDRTVTSLDGDVVRHHLSKGLGFSREDRETNILRIGYVAAEISRHGGMAICSPIAPFESTRQQVKSMVERAGGGFVLVHVSTPLEECERRDRKGLYARARAGEIPDFTGISSPYEEPTNVLKIDTTDRLIEVCLRELLDALVADGWLSP